MTFHRIRIYSFIVTAGLMTTACGKKQEAVKMDSFPVHVQTAERKTLEEKLSVSGTLKAQNEATLFSRVPGKLKDNVLKEGDGVKKDQAVALVERDEVGVTFEPAPVPSTLNGVVGRTYLDRGMHVGLDTPVALIVDDSAVVAKADIPERFAGRVTVGQNVSVRIEAYPNQAFRGEITKVSPVVSPVTRTAPIEVTLNNSARKLKSGMFVELSVTLARKEGALAVPIAAVVPGTTPALFIAKDGKAERREVVLGLQTMDLVEVQQGLERGETVITSGLFALQNGSPIEILIDKATGAPAGE